MSNSSDEPSSPDIALSSSPITPSSPSPLPPSDDTAILARLLSDLNQHNHTDNVTDEEFSLWSNLFPSFSSNSSLSDYYDYTVDPSWTNVFEDDKKYYFWKRKDPTAEIYFVRALIFLPNIHPFIVFHSLHNPDARRQWDGSFTELIIKESKKSMNFDILYSVIKVPFPLATRDTLQRRSFRIKKYSDIKSNQSSSIQSSNTISSSIEKSSKSESSSSTDDSLSDYQYDVVGDEYLYVYKSTDCDRLSAERKGYIRQISMGCFYCRKIEMISNNMNGDSDKKKMGTRLDLIMRSDPRGMIPKMILNTVAPLMAKKWVDRLVEFCQKRHDDELTTKKK